MTNGVPSVTDRLAACGLCLLLLVASSGASAAAGVQLWLQSSRLAGFRYYEGRALWPQLHEGDVLSLVRDRDNPWDRRAVRVEWQGHMLGYVPRSDNAVVARLLDHGTHLRARIVRLTRSRNPWQRVLFDIYEPMGR